MFKKSDYGMPGLSWTALLRADTDCINREGEIVRT